MKASHVRRSKTKSMLTKCRYNVSKYLRAGLSKLLTLSIAAYYENLNSDLEVMAAVQKMSSHTCGLKILIGKHCSKNVSKHLSSRSLVQEITISVSSTQIAKYYSRARVWKKCNHFINNYMILKCKLSSINMSTSPLVRVCQSRCLLIQNLSSKQAS